MAIRVIRIVSVSLLAATGLCVVPMTSTGADPANQVALVSGKPVSAVVSTSGVEYAWTAVAGKHVTFSVTKSVLSGAWPLELQAYVSGTLAGGVAITNNQDSEYDFTPSQSGTATLVIGQEAGGNLSISGTLTLTYAKDVTGAMKVGVAKKVHIKYPGQHAELSFNAVVGQPVTFTVTSQSSSEGSPWSFRDMSVKR